MFVMQNASDNEKMFGKIMLLSIFIICLVLTVKVTLESVIICSVWTVKVALKSVNLKHVEVPITVEFTKINDLRNLRLSTNTNVKNKGCPLLFRGAMPEVF
uniref:Uncharacterized protein n=1 Tax=Cacopsylla melanoneura TaxID=428564 RepID=A0A8D8R9A3_9HEMI